MHIAAQLPGRGDERRPGLPRPLRRCAGCAPDDFRPRPSYGRYLRAVFGALAGDERLRVVRARAAGLSARGVALEGGGEIRADEVVVATGNPAPAQPAAQPDHPDYVAARSGDWRAVVDGLRPQLDRLWQLFTPAEQEAFLRHLARADGRVRDGLWLVGPLRRGARWETTAVPEIRAQARQFVNVRNQTSRNGHKFTV